MKTVLKSLMMLALAALLFWSCNLDHGQDLEASQTSSADARLDGCTDCGEILTTCQQGCLDAVGGSPQNDPDGFTNCMVSCVENEFAYCIHNIPYVPPSYVFAEYGNTLCHMDIDEHLYYIEAEFYTADRYDDASCRNYPDAYRLRMIGSVRSNYWSIGGFEGKIESKIAELAAQGYIPTITEDDCDTCPTPRT